MYFPSFDEPPILHCSHFDMTLAHEDTTPCHPACGPSYLGTMDTWIHDRRNV